jgi:hypothetical protein
MLEKEFIYISFKKRIITSLKENFIGTWVSDDPDYEILEFDDDCWTLSEKRGKWAIQRDQIWMINEPKETGMKWFFKFHEGNDLGLTLYDPEDFIYQGAGRYLYLQFSDPHLSVEFKKVK